MMFYYVLLGAAVLAFIGCRALLQSRMGYCWLAIREDEEAARSVGIDTFRYKMLAVMISAGMTAFAGVIYAFYYNNLFPDQVFNISQSILIILAPFVGGLGTLFGPILGSFVLEAIAEGMRVLMAWFGIDLPGTNQLFFGVVLLTVVIALPDGVWPWLRGRMGLTGQQP
jgi:branched-chain amino acid transport system permease protein